MGRMFSFPKLSATIVLFSLGVSSAALAWEPIPQVDTPLSPISAVERCEIEGIMTGTDAITTRFGETVVQVRIVVGTSTASGATICPATGDPLAVNIENGAPFVALRVGPGAIIRLQWTGVSSLWGPSAGEWTATMYESPPVAMGLHDYFVVRPDGTMDIEHRPPADE